MLDGLCSVDDLEDKEEEEEDDTNLDCSTDDEDSGNVITFEIDASEGELEVKP